MESPKALVGMPGPMVSSTKASGSTAWNTALVCGKVLRATLMLVNGSLARLMAMAFILGLMVIVMKGNLKIVSNTARGWRNSPMATSTRAFTFRANPPASANTIGRMGVTSRAHSRQGCAVGTGYGRKGLGIVTSTKVNTWTTRNQVMAYSLGRAVTSTRATTRTTLEMATARCIGRMAVSTRGIGGMVFSMAKGRSMCRGRGSRGACFRIILLCQYSRSITTITKCPGISCWRRANRSIYRRNSQRPNKSSEAEPTPRRTRSPSSRHSQLLTIVIRPECSNLWIWSRIIITSSTK